MHSNGVVAVAAKDPIVVHTAVKNIVVFILTRNIEGILPSATKHSVLPLTSFDIVVTPLS